ncbi:MAG: hypothetical protein J6C64_12315 [Lachnospiraceae bacterium]|nr:hypothetical protein [Lachnospiraceae bacterium]
MRKRKIGCLTAVLGMAAVMSMAGCSDSKQTTQQLVTPKGEETVDMQEGQSENNRQGSNGESSQDSTAEGTAGTVAGNTGAGGIAQQVQAPDRYQADFSDGAVNVHVDAPVIIPDSAGFKLYKVSGRPFSQEDYDAVSHVLLEDAPLWSRDYEVMEESHGFIKEEIEERIAQIKETAERNGGLDQINEAEAKGRKYGETLADWEVLLEAAPEEPVIVEVPGVVPYVKAGKTENEKQNAYSMNMLDGNATVNGEDYYVFMDNNFQEDWQWIRFTVRSRERRLGENRVFLSDEEIPAGLSEEEICEEAAGLVKEMGFSDFEPAGGEYFQKLQQAEDDENVMVPKGTIGYGINFTRTLEGIPVTYTSNSGTTVGTDVTAYVTWPYETLRMVFDEKGMTDFSWENPYTIEKQSDEYVFLMPFTDIQNIFEEIIIKKYKTLAEYDNDIAFYFNINEVRLGYMRVRDSAGAGTGTMIPVWDFFGTQTIVYAEEDEPYVDAGPYSSWLTVNAMDGTVIDRGLGY